MVAGMVTVGGLTRLTKSGLSMTDWKPHGGLPPITDEEWRQQFEVYKQFPEWQQRKSMTLDEFKFIYFWEYGHRMLGRTVGLAFTLPLLYFLARGRIPKHQYGRMAALFTLGGTQGLVGWWMVQSGLNVDPLQKKEIRVSPYRLATHLGMAFTTYSLLVYTAMDVLNPTTPRTLQGITQSSLYSSLRRLRLVSCGTAGLVFVTAMSGAFVAGNDAGCAYNTWPLMDESFVPEGLLAMEPAWRNLFENTATVQFDHRLLAYATSASVGGLYALARSDPRVWAKIPQQTRLAATGALGMVAVQVTLGISTLLLYVPIELAAAHQAGSLVLLSFMVATAHSLRSVPLNLPRTMATAGPIGVGSAVVAGSSMAYQANMK